MYYVYFLKKVNKKLKKIIGLSKSGAGFTILEMLVVISVMTMLTGILIVYSRGSENQIILFKEHAKLVSVFFHTKTLAYQTFSQQDPKPCAYGVARVNDTFFVFKDMPETAGDCTTADQRFDGAGSDEVVETVTLDPRVVVSAADTTFTEVLFTPPDPTILLNYGATSEAQVAVKAKDSDNKLGIKINDAGQVSAFKPA